MKDKERREREVAWVRDRVKQVRETCKEEEGKKKGNGHGTGLELESKEEERRGRESSMG